MLTTEIGEAAYENLVSWQYVREARMAQTTKPLLAVYVAWHPDFATGAALAETLRGHFRRDLFGSVAGGTGLSVLFRSETFSDEAQPLPIDADSAHATAIIVLADKTMANDPAWRGYVAELSEAAATHGLAYRLFPIAFDDAALDMVTDNAIRILGWNSDEQAAPAGRLISELSLELSRMLRHYLTHLQHPADAMEELDRYLQPVRVFLSHSKHDGVGLRIAKSFRQFVHEGRGLATFFDVNDIPSGVSFETVLEHQVRQSAVVAIHTDSYSSREWCRREIIEAKKFNVPLVVANCIGDRDERGFPYMGNVPIVRMSPNRIDRLDSVVARLLDEVLKDFLWKCRIAVNVKPGIKARFLPRPPELIALAAEEMANLIVYPDPPLSREEQRLFEAVAPDVSLRTMTEWLAGAI